MTEHSYPAYVSFTDAAEIIVREGIASSMTPRGLRYMATARSKEEPDRRWPFGNEPGQERYLQGGRTRMMRTELLLKYLVEHPPTGRGPDQGERKNRSAG